MRIYPIPPERQMASSRNGSGQPGSLSPRGGQSAAMVVADRGNRSRSGSLVGQQSGGSNMGNGMMNGSRPRSNSRSGSGMGATTFV